MRTVRCNGRLLGGEGAGVSQQALRQTLPPWTEWLTDRCKNITFPQLRLRTVKMGVNGLTARSTFSTVPPYKCFFRHVFALIDRHHNHIISGQSGQKLSKAARAEQSSLLSSSVILLKRGRKDTKEATFQALILCYNTNANVLETPLSIK